MWSPAECVRGSVLVTGGAKRIGREICLRLSEEGFSIAIHYRNSEQEANQLVGEIEASGGKAISIRCDLNDYDSVKGLINKVTESLGTVVGVVNNASIFSFDRIENISEELWT